MPEYVLEKFKGDDEDEPFEVVKIAEDGTKTVENFDDMTVTTITPDGEETVEDIENGSD